MNEQEILQRADELRGKARGLMAEKVSIGSLVAVVIPAILYAGLSGDGFDKFLGFISATSLFTITSFILLVIVLGLVYVSQKIRARPWFDKDGAAEELRDVRKRIGTEDETANDCIAVAIQYGTTTIFIGIVFLTYFLSHHG